MRSGRERTVFARLPERDVRFDALVIDVYADRTRSGCCVYYRQVGCVLFVCRFCDVLRFPWPVHGGLLCVDDKRAAYLNAGEHENH